jgi:hypothetical protein
MSRNKVKVEDQKQTISVRIPNELIGHLEGIKNKSKFFEWLLEEHFNSLKTK